MRKIIAEQVPPEHQESIFWQHACERFVLDGNRRMRSYKMDEYEQIEKYGVEWIYDWEDVRDLDFDFEDSWWGSRPSTRRFLEDEDIKKSNGDEWSDEEIKRWEDVLDDMISEYTKHNEEEHVLEMMSLIAGGKWELTILRGYLQGDWQKCYYDTETVSDKMLRYIEADYFNLGTEWNCWEEGDEDNNCGVYCYSLMDEDIKEEIKDAMGGDEVELRKFAGWSRTANYVTA